MSGRPRIDRSLVGRSVRLSERGDHISASFRFMTPNTMFFIILALMTFQGIMVLCFLSDAVGAYISGTESNGFMRDGFLAERYLGPFYDIFSIPSSFYAGLLSEWWGWAPNQMFIVMIAGFGSLFTWLAIIRIADWTDLFPRVLSVLPFPPFTYGKTIRFYPDRLRIGMKTLPFNPSASRFRLELPDSIRGGRGGSRVLYGKQVISYDNGAAKTPIAIFAFANQAENVQNALSVIADFWRANGAVFAEQVATKVTKKNGDDSDPYVTHD